MINLIQAEKDFTGALLSSAQLRSINVMTQRKLHLSSEVDMATVWTTARNGVAGAGIIVEMPTANCESPNVSGPVLDWVFSAHVLENPILNFAAPTPNFPLSGTMTSAEQIVQMILDEIHHLADSKLATFKATKNPVTPANLEGMAVGYRVSFSLNKARSFPTPRTGTLQGTVANGMLSLVCLNDPPAQIRFTLDGSFPASQDGGNAVSMVYGQPIPTAPGLVVRARAYANGKLGGEIFYQTF